jgi:hypothetical protein
LAFAAAFADPLLLAAGFRYDKLARSFLGALLLNALLPARFDIFDQ